MVDTVTNRREVLKAVGAAGGLTLVAPRSVRAMSTDFGQKRLVEVGIEYDVPDYNYHGTKHGGSPVNFADEAEEQMVHYPMLPRLARIIERNDFVVGATTIEGPPFEMGGQGTSSVVIEMSGYRRPVRSISLREPHRPPKVEVHVVDDEPIVIIPGRQFKLSEGQSESIELETQTLATREQRLTDERASVKGMPDHRVGFERKLEPITVEATPVIKVKYYGALDVKRLMA